MKGVLQRPNNATGNARQPELMAWSRPLSTIVMHDSRGALAAAIGPDISFVQLFTTETRGNRIGYYILNDGYDTEESSQNRMSSPVQPARDLDILDLPGPSSLPAALSQSSLPSSLDKHWWLTLILLHPNPHLPRNPLLQPSRPKTKGAEENWTWCHFNVEQFQHRWVERRSKKTRLMDRRYTCTLMDKNTGGHCK